MFNLLQLSKTLQCLFLLSLNFTNNQVTMHTNNNAYQCTTDAQNNYQMKSNVAGIVNYDQTLASSNDYQVFKH